MEGTKRWPNFVDKSNINANYALAPQRGCVTSTGKLVFAYGTVLASVESTLEDILASTDNKQPEIKTITTEHKNAVSHVSACKSRNMVYSIDLSGCISAYDFNEDKTSVIALNTDTRGFGSNLVYPTSDNVFSVSQTSKRISVWSPDGNSSTPLHSIYSVGYPTAACLVHNVGDHENVIAVAENGAVALWDIRENTSRMSVRNETAANEISAIAYSGNYIACGTANRSVHIIDSRKLTSKAVWQHASKSHIGWVHVSPVEPICYTIAMEGELRGGDIKRGQGLAPTRGTDHITPDSPWLGVGHHHTLDIIAGVTISGSLYVINNVSRKVKKVIPGKRSSSEKTPKKSKRPRREQTK